MKLLLTGATGFVGTHMLAALQAGGHDIVCLARQVPARIEGDNIAFMPYTDADGTADWGCVLPGCETVIHLAGRAHVMHEHAPDALAAFRKVNVEQTLALARQAIAHGVRRFIFISSIKVNGEQTQDQPFRSTDLPTPQDAYGVSKHEAEQSLLALAQGKMEIVIVRPPLIYGPGVKANFLQLINTVQRGIPLPLGAIDNQRSLVYVGNLVDLLLTCLSHPQAANRIWLVSDNQDVSTPDLIRLLGEALQMPARLLNVRPAWLTALAKLAGKEAQAEKLLASLQVDISPALQTLGWRPPYSLQQGLAITTHALRR